MDALENSEKTAKQQEEVSTEKDNPDATSDVVANEEEKATTEETPTSIERADTYDKVDQSEMEVVAESSAVTKIDEQKFCVNCGAEILANQLFCSKCGHKVGETLDAATGAGKKTHSKKPFYIIGGVATAVIAIIAALIITRGVQAKDIRLSKDTLTIQAGKTASLLYTINPTNTKDKTVTWKSSNDSIAQVSDGAIKAISEGDCTITISTKNGMTDTCSITVTTGPDFLKMVFGVCCDSSYASITPDGSCLKIDTNPQNIDDYINEDACGAIGGVNESLELPDSIISRMESTRAIDGMQSYSGNGVEVSWTYSPSNGLEVQYSLTDNS